MKGFGRNKAKNKPSKGDFKLAAKAVGGFKQLVQAGLVKFDKDTNTLYMYEALWEGRDARFRTNWMRNAWIFVVATLTTTMDDAQRKAWDPDQLELRVCNMETTALLATYSSRTGVNLQPL